MSNGAIETMKLELEIDQLRRENERLDFELKNLREEAPDLQKVRFYLPVLSWLISGIAIIGSIVTYFVSQHYERESRQVELRREAARPFWEKQLGYYLEAAERAAFIAVSENHDLQREAAERFWVLYWGPLAAVEDIGLTNPGVEVEKAMVEFGKLLTPTLSNDRVALRNKALDLARAIRTSTSPAFDLQRSKEQTSRNAKAPTTLK